ncbi:MAG: hypothetical protein AB4911_10280 [Oscillochloridaceae bacterium umkhey_bin13]
MSSANPVPQRPGWQQHLAQVAVIVGMASAGALFGAVVGRWVGERASTDATSPWLLLVALVLGLPLAILGHELGHVLGGRLVGFRFLLLIVGPLKVDRVGERIRFGWNRSLGLVGGLAASVPNDDHKLRQRMLVMVAGGPLASLIIGGSSLLVVTHLVGSAPLVVFAALNLAIAVATLLPLPTAGFQTDGRRLMMLLRGGARAERWCATALATAMTLVQRPREVPPALLATALGLPDASLDDLGAHTIAYSVALDQGDRAAAEAHLNYVLTHQARLPAALRPALGLESAYLAALRGEAEAARNEFEAARKGALIEAYTLARVEAAVLHAEGRPAEASARAQVGLDLLAKLQPGPSGIGEAELLRELAG